jgi:Glucodextranase, domain B
MRKFVTLMVALALVMATLIPAFSIANADGDDGIRDGEPNTPATMIVKRWQKVGYDRDGNMLNPSTLDYTEVTRTGFDGTGYRLFPWQKEGEQVWGRASDDYDFEMSRLLPTSGNHDWLGRFDESNYDYDYDNAANNYAWYTEIYMFVEPNSGASQQSKKWYAVVDREGNLFLDPDGKFHRCGLLRSADPMYFEAGTLTYAEGSCRTNPRALLDPIPNNNTQGPYNLRFGDRGALDHIYFWWKYDQNRNLVDRVWKVGWADNNDYDPVPDLKYGIWDSENPDTWSVISYIPSYDPYTKTDIAQADVDWDAKLDTIPFVMSLNPIWPNTTMGTECYYDANGNDRYDPYEFTYRKGPGDPVGFFTTDVQVGDIRISNTSTENGNFKVNYRSGTTVGANDFDLGSLLLPFHHMDSPMGYPIYIHTHDTIPNAEYDYGEFIYQKGAMATAFGNTWTMVPHITGNTVILVEDVTGFEVDDDIAIYDPVTGTYHITRIDAVDPAILPFPTITIDDPLPGNFVVFSSVVELHHTEIGDIRLTPVNTRHNNNSRSWNWHGAWWTDALILLEVLEGGCYTPKYNITVESDMWMGGYPSNGEFVRGEVPSEATAALHSPNGDLVAAAQRIQKTTVLDPTGLQFQIPATTFEDIKLEYREYIGLEIFKDDGINNNIGEGQFTVNCVRADITDDYMMYDSTEEFVGSADVETAADYAWSLGTIPFTDERYVDLSGEGALGVGEPMYRDLDLSNTISAGDVRITDITVENVNSNIISYPAGSVVTAGDADVNHFAPLGAELVEIPMGNEFHDMKHGCIPANGLYDIGEPIYYQAAMGGASVLYTNDFVAPIGGGLPNVNGWDGTTNWFPVDDMIMPAPPINPPMAPGGSIDDGFNLFPAGTEVLTSYDAGNTRMQSNQGTVLLTGPPPTGGDQRFEASVLFEPTATPMGNFSDFGIIFRWNAPDDYYVLRIIPNVDGSAPGNIYSDENSGLWTAGIPAVDQIRFRVGHYTGDPSLSVIVVQTDVGYAGGWGTPLDYTIDLVGDDTTILINGFDLFGPMNTPTATGNPGVSLFGFSHAVDFGALFGASTASVAYIDNVNLYDTAIGGSLDTVRLSDVWVNGTFYPAGTKVVAGDFYRIKNPVYGVTTGKNTCERYLDIDVLPGDIGLRYEIDGLSPDDDDFKSLKIEKTSHVKVYLDHELEGVYAIGKVIGDKRNRLFYRPDSFYVNTIPVDQQVIYSSPAEAEQNFFHPHRSIQGDQVYVTLRETDANVHPYGTGAWNEYLDEIIDTTAILDAKNPVYEFEFTPYRGTIVDDIGQELPFLLRAYMDDGGIASAPQDSRFTYSFMPNKNAAERTILATDSVYYDNNYVDPWHMERKWEIDEAYANFHNQAYSRAARMVFSPYEAEFMAECGLGDKYDCFGMIKLHVDPEGIEIIPASPCVDPLSYRYPNISLKLNAYDNPDDINDPAGYPMAVTLTDQHGDPQLAFATYNVNGAGIRYICTMKYWNLSHTVDQEAYFIVQVNDDGSWLGWQMFEATLPGIIDPFDTIAPMNSYVYLQKLNNRGTDGHDVGDNDCSVGTGVVDLCGSGWPPLGDISLFDTYGPTFCDPTWGTPPYYGTVFHYGVRTLISPKTETEEGGSIAVVCQPMNNEEDLHIRVHTSHVIVDYNSTMEKHGSGASFFGTDRAGIFQASPGTSNANLRYDPSVSLNYDTNPPGIRNLPLMETVDYCDVINLKVLPPDTELNFNNMYIVDHALQYSEVEYAGPETPPNGNALVALETPERWIRPDYNPLCVLRPLSHDTNTDVRCYPGGQTHLMRVENSLKGNGFNATPALWRRQFNKLGTEFFGLTDYGLYFELTREEVGLWGLPTTFADGLIKRIEIKGPFMTPLDLDPAFDSIKYRSGTAAGSMLGYTYKGLRYVPIKYDYSGSIIVDKLNYLTYELGPGNFSSVTSPACTIPGDVINFSHVNSYLSIGKELDYRRVNRPMVPNISSSQRVMVFDEIIPIGPGRIDITVWLENGVKKVFQDCCVEPPADGIDVAGIKIDGMPHFVTVDETNRLTLKLTEGYGIESVGPPPEFGKGIQDYKECNDALVFVWQDRGIYDPVERLYDYAGDGYCSMAPQSTDITEIYSPYTEDDDLNSDGKISFDNYETEIIGTYDINTNTWTNGLIDGRTFHRQNGEYKFDVFTNTVGIDFGSYGTEAEPDHVIAPDETLDITVTAYKYGDDDNSRSFRPFWGGRDTVGGESAFSHEVYLAGRTSAFVEAREDLTVIVTPEPLTAGCTPELLDPTTPLTFEVKWDNGEPLNLRMGVPDPRGGDEVKQNVAWMHLIKDPHPDDQYYYPGDLLPQYYWLRTDLHNYDFSPIANQVMYGYDTDPFMPIEFGWNPTEGIYAFNGFVANDKGKFETVIYSPDRRHKATATVHVALPQVDYELMPWEWMTNTHINTFFPVNGGKDDFTVTGADFRYYVTRFTFKSAQGRLIQGLAESTSVCQGGEGMYARFTPFFTRHEYFDWVSPPSTTIRFFRRYANHVQTYNYYLDGGNTLGGREQLVMFVDADGSGRYGDIPNEELLFNSIFMNVGQRVGGNGPFAPFYPTVNSMFEDGTYNHWQAWDGPFDKVSATPDGYGVGSIYNESYEGMYMFADSNRDHAFNYKDSYNIDNRGQGEALVFVDDMCKFGATVGVTNHALKPKFSDIYGGTDPYNEFSPQRTVTRFVHINQGNAELGTSDGVYSLDWDAFPDKMVTAEYAKATPYWAETREEIGKDVLDPDNYDLAYGIENHVWVEFFPADPRDLPVPAGQTVTIGNPDALHRWGGAKSEDTIFSTIIADNINPNTRAAQMFVTPTGTGVDVMALNKTGLTSGNFFDHCTSYNMIKFDVIMSIQILADSLEPLKVGVPGTLIVHALKTAGGEPIEGATIHIKGAGVEMEKKTDAEGKVEFSITPIERGRILITAEKESMKGTYTSAFVERYVAPPVLDLDPIAPITGENSVTIKGRTNEGTRITINGRPISVNKDGSFTYLLKLSQGKNSIIIVATNEASQTITKILVIESRVTASEIILDPLGELENVTEIRLRGHVEPGTNVKILNETTGKEFDAVVTNDVFVADVEVEAGENKFTITATDPRTGKSETLPKTVYIWTTTTLMFTIGSDIVIKDGVVEKIMVPPMIKGGIAMVPIEAIAQYFGITTVPVGTSMTLTWGANLLTLSVDSKTATLSSNTIDLKAAPIIQNGVMLMALDDVVYLKPDNGTLTADTFDSKSIIIIRKK